MKKIISTCMVALAALVTTSSYGQMGRPGFSIGAELGIPAADLNTTHKIGIGGSAKVAFPVAPTGALTLQAGFISYSGDETRVGNTIVKNEARNFIPIKAGYRYRFMPGGFYVEPQLGYTSINTPTNRGSATGGFTYAANLGYFLSRAIDVSARYEGVALKNEINYDQLAFRLAYNF